MQHSKAIQTETGNRGKTGLIDCEVAGERAFAINASAIILALILMVWFITG